MNRAFFMFERSIFLVILIYSKTCVRSTIKTVVWSSQSEPSFSKVELRNAERKLHKAFIEFHHQLLLLKRYSFVWIHHPAHGDVRGKHLLLEAIYNGVQTRNILGFREIFNVLQGSQFSLAHLDLEMDKETKKFQLQTELLPVDLVGVQAIRTVCYYIWGDFRKRSNTCLDSIT